MMEGSVEDFPMSEPVASGSDQNNSANTTTSSRSSSAVSTYSPVICVSPSATCHLFSVTASTTRKPSVSTVVTSTGNITTISTSASASCLETTMVSVDFEVTQYYSEAMKSMYGLYLAGKLADVTLVVSSERIRCHRVVLAGASPYFRAMFTNEMLESAMPEIQLHYISAAALRHLVEFAYTGRVKVTERNVCELLTASSMVQMPDVVRVCCIFLEQQLHFSNVIGIHTFALSNACTTLAQAAEAYLDKNFGDVIKYDEFLALNCNQLISLLKRDSLTVTTEAEAYSAAIRWVNFDVTSRLDHLVDLLPVVRCHNLAPQFIRTQIKNCNLLNKVTAARSYLLSVLRDLVEHRHVAIRRRTAGYSEVLYSAGGYLRYSLGSFECYNPNTKQWHSLADIPSPRSGLSACSVRGYVYLVGGRNNNEQGNIDAPHMDCYDPACNSWHTCAPMSVPRNRVAVGVIDDMIYAVGGSTNTLPHNTCECYDVDANQWTPIACMHSRRIGLGVAVLNRLLYAVGGFDGECRLNTVERYDPETDSWEKLANLNRARSGAGVVAVGEYVYTVGGYDSCSQLRTVERYDPTRNCWEYCSPMLHPRSALSATVLNDEIWVFGGYDGTEFLSSIEVYNPCTNKWTERAFMDCGKSGHAIVVSREPDLKV